MKRLIIFCMIGLALFNLNAQDLIVSTKTDSINCSITKIDSENISYKFTQPGGNVISTQIPLSLVLEYDRGYYKRIERHKYSQTPGNYSMQLVVSVHGGYSHRTAPVMDGLGYVLTEYMKSLKPGYNLGADIIYYFSNTRGFGVKLSRFGASSSMEGVSLPDGLGGEIKGTMSDNIRISFAGPVYSMRLVSPNGKHSMLMNLGAGYMAYQNNATYVYLYTITGNAAGIVYDLGYNYGLTKNLTLGIQTSLYAGILTEYKITNGQNTENIELSEDEREGLGRIDLSVKLSYRF